MSRSAQGVRGLLPAMISLGRCLPVVLALLHGGCYVHRYQHVNPIGGHTQKLTRGIEFKVGVTTTRGDGYNGFSLRCRRDRTQVGEQVEVRVDWARSFFKYEDDPPSPFTALPNEGYGRGNRTTAKPDPLEATLPLTSQEIVFPLALVRRNGPVGNMWYQAEPMRDGRVEAHFTVLVDSEQIDVDFAYHFEQMRSLSWFGDW